MSAREACKAAARAAATVLVLPAVASFRLRSRLTGPDRAVEASTQALAWIPGLTGQYLRRAFLTRALAYCAPTAVIEYGTIFSAAGTRIEEYAYIGPRCHIGLADIRRDALIAAAVHIPSGRLTHGIDDLDRPIREQRGQQECVRIGAGAWIGSAAVVMAHVGADAVIGAGAVVTRPVPDRVVAAGVPARVVRSRGGAARPEPVAVAR